MSGLLDIGFSHNKIDIVTGLRPAVHPKRVPAAQREEDAVGLQS